MSDSIKHRNLRKCIAIVLWLLLWQVASCIIDSELRLVSPWEVLKALVRLLGTVEFYRSVFHSLGKISLGFLLALVTGILLALLAYLNHFLREMILIFMRLVKSVPVASFVILALLWVKSKDLSILISFFMVLPIIFLNVLQGITSTNHKLLEMAQVFCMRRSAKFRYIYMPAVLPYFLSACSLGLGLCWKAGIAAEVIGLPNHSIGERLYEAKLYLMTGDLFAWTAMIVLLSAVFEKAVMFLLRLLGARITKTVK